MTIRLSRLSLFVSLLKVAELKSKTFIPYKNPMSMFHNRTTRQKTLSAYLKEIPTILQGSFFGRVQDYPSIPYPAQHPKELKLNSEGNVTRAPSIYIPVTDPQWMQVVLGFCFPQQKSNLLPRRASIFSDVKTDLVFRPYQATCIEVFWFFFPSDNRIKCFLLLMILSFKMHNFLWW